jgi:hypothetical protein
MVLYIASSYELPTSDFIEGVSKFYVKKVTSGAIIDRFTLPNVYYCGSYEECGCGFAYDLINARCYEPENLKLAIESVNALFSYLKEQFRPGYFLELYSCWSDEEKLEKKTSKQIDLESFCLGDTFEFNQLEYIKVIWNQPEI